MTSQYTTEDIRRKYNEQARKYAMFERLQEILGMRKLRRSVLRGASGDVLEVAVGTGVNFPHYPEGCRITAVDVSPAMLKVAEERAKDLGLDVDFHLMDAEALELPNDSFETVVSSLTLCTFPDPIAALHEMGRVCQKDGRILLLEHGRSDRGRLARYQDLREEAHAKQFGCHWNREPLELVERAGLRPVFVRRVFFGIFHQIEARGLAQ